ncbi:NADH dehydrogenase [ubiquinone] 1 alpha subcomplex assembly factor 4 [Eublepharis macularius]|uniref:NADH dehydrogenase [ubiquinone] 1 alpha subcomplex assembly factor 4 n=1 Tax=Eublepharis macularius TaxID=481883 RepID=A0AA97JX13_EUBMA|nr:NADH dehydrogenase [ubiquinone] 1 alpha subcomplex assembly factor 4 [Eublepharis macularius]
MMGARVTRVFKLFNLESRAHREIGKAKPAAAPRHPGAASQPDPDQFQEEIKKKDEHLHTLLKDVYVDSRDPPVNVINNERSLPSKTEERRLTKAGQLGHLDVKTIPKGKISVIEALALLNNHNRSPNKWTAETIAKEYSLELKDVTALLTYFIPFSVEIFPPQDKKALQSR